MANIFTSQVVKGKKWQVYALVDPRNQEIRYIGCTHSTLNQRLWEHLSDNKREHNQKSNWIRELLADGLKPRIELLESGFGDGWAVVEQRYIARYRIVGSGVLNTHYQYLSSSVE